MNVIYALGIWEGGGLAYLADLSEDYFEFPILSIF